MGTREFLGDWFCEEGEGFRIGDADAKRCSRRERTLKRDRAVSAVPCDGCAVAVAGLLGDNSAFVANPFAVVFERYLLECFGENRGAFMLDCVGNGCITCFEACSDGVRARDESCDIADCRARVFQNVQRVVEICGGFSGIAND